MGALGLTAAVGMVLAVSSGWSGPSPLVENFSKVVQEEREGGEEDAGTSGLGDGGIPVAAGVEKPLPARGGLNVNVPKEPLPGQSRSPCVSPLVEINTGCWVGPIEEKPP
jgi:hypothetical protein